MPPAGILNEEHRMETSKQHKISNFEVSGPIGHEDIRGTKSIFLTSDSNAGGNYESALFDERIATYHLVDVKTGKPIGFVAIKKQLEYLGADYPANAFFAVHYVYVMPEYRGLGLGGLLRKRLRKLYLNGSQNNAS